MVYSYSIIFWRDKSSQTIFIIRQIRGEVCDNHAANFWHTRNWRKNILMKWKAWASITRDSECPFFMTRCTLSKAFEIISLEIKGSCFWDSIFFGLEQVVIMPGWELSWGLLHDVNDADQRAVPAWGKRTNSMLRY